MDLDTEIPVTTRTHLDNIPRTLDVNILRVTTSQCQRFALSLFDYRGEVLPRSSTFERRSEFL